ncbi:hypothetical protein CCAX7_19190 [Capsulimonas corticalis]|uniref:Uncharacterized protein n=1 Tax=Capsulimonas corticalis TaxID=2219043 RepID=A0A402D588_9BACT|nr:acyltransferase [Capsulimonas corticalis]BDI29868.1 hypothetical protein CCAX7_19190 [Capsulimonas corticalis]
MHFIDGLRAVAMIAVLLCHANLYAGISHIWVHVGGHDVNLANVLQSGHLGVNLFLLLSGFCLYWPFVKGGGRAEPTLAQYAYRRCRRILPPYYVTLAIFGGLGLLQAVTHHQIFHRQLTIHYMEAWLAWHAVMAHNLSPAHVVALDAPLWSLALEFQLYVLFPIFVEAYRRWNKHGVLLLVLALSSLYRAAIPPAVLAVDPLNGFVLMYSVFGRCFEFALGMYVAYVLSRWPQGEKSPLRPVDYVLGAAVIAGGIWRGHVFTDAAWGVVFAALVLAASRASGPIGRFLSQPFLVRMGIFSYSVYLIHQPIIMGVGGKLAGHHLSNVALWAIVIGVLLPALIGIGYVYHLLFEKPFMSTKKPNVASTTASETAGAKTPAVSEAETAPALNSR